jgi:hypothetical protein
MSFVALLPVILQILGWALRWYGASEETIRRYSDLIKSTQDDGLISVKIKNSIMKQREEILAEIEKEKANDP